MSAMPTRHFSAAAMNRPVGRKPLKRHADGLGVAQREITSSFARMKASGRVNVGAEAHHSLASRRSPS
jgi:hypothetical protein